MVLTKVSVRSFTYERKKSIICKSIRFCRHSVQKKFSCLRLKPAKKKRQEALQQVVIGFHHFQRQLLSSLQELTEMSTKSLSHSKLASGEAAKCNSLDEGLTKETLNCFPSNAQSMVSIGYSGLRKEMQAKIYVCIYVISFYRILSR